MRDHYNNRLAKEHFDWPLLIASYMLALYGVLAITIANYNPNLGSDRSLQQLVMDAANGRLQLIWVIVSMVVIAIIMTVRYDIIGRLWPVIYAVDILLLGVVLTTAKINGMAGGFQLLDQIGTHHHAFQGADTASRQGDTHFSLFCLYLFALWFARASDCGAAGYRHADGLLRYIRDVALYLRL